MKHKDLIIAWANGAKIEYRKDANWYLVSNPSWQDTIEYRIHIPARNAFKEGKKVLVKYLGRWDRVTEGYDFSSNREYVILPADTYWQDMQNKGAEIEFKLFDEDEWLKVTPQFSWKHNSAEKFREVIKPLVFTEGPIVKSIITVNNLVRTDIPVSFYDLRDTIVKIEININTGEIKII